jgi:hypothetical protein
MSCRQKNIAFTVAYMRDAILAEYDSRPSSFKKRITKSDIRRMTRDDLCKIFKKPAASARKHPAVAVKHAKKVAVRKTTVKKVAKQETLPSCPTFPRFLENVRRAFPAANAVPEPDRLYKPFDFDEYPVIPNYISEYPYIYGQNPDSGAKRTFIVPADFKLQPVKDGKALGYTITAAEAKPTSDKYDYLMYPGTSEKVSPSVDFTTALPGTFGWFMQARTHPITGWEGTMPAQLRFKTAKIADAEDYLC